MCNLSENIWETGLEEGKMNMLRELVVENLLTLSAAAKKANMTVEEFKTAVKL